MARRKFSNNRRYEPASERSFNEYLLSTPHPQTSRTELMRLVRGGEDTYLELKVKLSNAEKIAQGICALANTEGGTIVFGVNDGLRVEGVDDAEAVRDELVHICREQIVPPLFPYIDMVAFDSGRRIVALNVEGKRRPYRTRDGGKFFVRIGAEKREATREELSQLIGEARPAFYENVPVLGATLEDIDDAQLWTLVRHFDHDPILRASAQEFSTADVLEKDLLLAVNETPTVAGLLLLGNDSSVAELLPRASVTLVRFAGDQITAPEIERREIVGNLHSLYEGALRFITRYSDLVDTPQRTSSKSDTNANAVFEQPRAATSDASETDVTKDKLQATQGAEESVLPRDEMLDEMFVPRRANYHRASVKEAVANMLVHRDLALREHPTRVFIFDRSIEFINARRSNGFMPVSQRAIRYGVPHRLNPQLASLFKSEAYGLDVPSGGLPALLRNAARFANRRPELHAFNDEFRLRLHGA